jgi:hypothetical protein
MTAIVEGRWFALGWFESFSERISSSEVAFSVGNCILRLFLGRFAADHCFEFSFLFLGFLDGILKSSSSESAVIGICLDSSSEEVWYFSSNFFIRSSNPDGQQ